MQAPNNSSYRINRSPNSRKDINNSELRSVLFLYLQYHGGTNFGRTAGGPFITTSYDYDAPIDEYGTRSITWSYHGSFIRVLFGSISMY